jgi:hypothetical protein
MEPDLSVLGQRRVNGNEMVVLMAATVNIAVSWNVTP